MILKRSDERRDDIAELERLSRGCDTAQKRRLETESKKLAAGVQGERNAAHVLNRLYGESERVGLLHDLRIGVRGEFAQIDHLVIHRGQGRIWLCETKNYGGRLQCNAHGDWTVWYGKNPTAVPSPVQQARLQAIVLRRWLEANGYANLEVVPLVLVAPTASIDRRQIPDDVTLVKWDQFGDWWMRQTNALGALSIARMGATALWDKRGAAWLRELGEKLVRAHEPIVFDWAARLGLEDRTGNEENADRKVEPAPFREGDPSQAEPMADGSGLDLSALMTRHGDITFVALGESEVAIRNPPVEPLIDVVRGTVKGRGRWQPRFRNWIVKVEDFREVRRQIGERLIQANIAGRT